MLFVARTVRVVLFIARVWLSSVVVALRSFVPDDKECWLLS